MTTTEHAPQVSQHFKSKTPAGVNSPGATTVTLLWSQMAEAQKRELSAIQPPTATVKLKYVYLDERTQEFRIKDRGSITRPLAFEKRRSGQFTTEKLRGAALLDELFENGSKARDEAVWDALLEATTAMRPDPANLRHWNDQVAIVLCARAGIDVGRFDLPHPHPAPRPTE
jgi:hypothetical protein